MIVVLLCAPVAGVYMFWAVQAAQQHQWGSVGGLAWRALVFFGVPSLGLLRLGRVLKRRKAPETPSTDAETALDCLGRRGP
jgi:hypothetical protein